MGKIEWAMWANEHAIASSFVTVLGGILAVSGQFRYWQIGVYAIVIGLLSFLFEYPRGRRQKGTSHERKFQYPLTVIVSLGRLITRNYFIRFVAYLVISVPLCFLLQTLLGGVCFMITSIIYLVSGIKGEEWLPIESQKEERGPQVIQEPKRPPPRRPNIPQGANTNQTEDNANRV